MIKTDLINSILLFVNSNPLYPGQSRTVLESLRARIEELEELANNQNSVRCLICMVSRP